MENTTKKSWQEELEELVRNVPEDMRQRAHDFLFGYLAAMMDDVKAAN